MHGTRCATPTRSPGRKSARQSPTPETSPTGFFDGSGLVVRLFADFRAAEREWHARTRIFPIMHVIGIRRRLVDENPWLPASLYKAFVAAKRAAYADLYDVTALKVTLPWLAAEAESTRALMGEDFWPYGIAQSRTTLEALVRYAASQGLIGRRPAVEDLFAPSTLDTVRV